MVNFTGSLPAFGQWVLSSILYDPANPFFFTGGFFLLFFLLFFLVSVPFGDRPRIRGGIILFFSLWFYYKCSGIFVLVILGAGVLNYLIALTMDKTGSDRRRMLLLYAGIISNILLLLLFKYTPWFSKVTELLAAKQWSFSLLAFPAGLSFYTFANLSYIIDVRKRVIQAEPSLQSYLTYITFFPIVQMGPIERAKNFLPQLSLPYRLTREDVAEGFFLIFSGAFKKMVIGD